MNKRELAATLVTLLGVGLPGLTMAQSNRAQSSAPLAAASPQVGAASRCDPGVMSGCTSAQPRLLAKPPGGPHDIMLVLDRSGSMYYDPASSALGLRTVDQESDAARLFAAMIDPSPSDGVRRLGLVSYASDASDPARNASLASVDGVFQEALVSEASHPFESALTRIEHTFDDGASSIGAGLEAATTLLCGGQPCSADTALVLLTDGLQNAAPCLPDRSGTGRCYGAAYDPTGLGNAQLCVMGLGSGADIDTHALTALTDGHGVFYQRDGTELAKGSADALGARTALLELFAQCAGTLLSTAPASDPKAVLDDDSLAGIADHHESCGDEQLLFVAGWGERSTRGDEMRLMVNDPEGNLVRPGRAAVTGIHHARFDVTRVTAPVLGRWRTQVIRHHTRYVNGFVPDAVVDLAGQGIPLARRQIQRLCPDGCQNVLHFEQTASTAESLYDGALQAEQRAGLVGSVHRISRDDELVDALAQEWDLIVFVNATAQASPAPYDAALLAALCQTSVPAIYTDTRPGAASDAMHRCSGAARSLDALNFTQILDAEDGQKRLLDGAIQLADPGIPLFSYRVSPLPWDELQRDDVASESQAQNAIVATSIDDTLRGVDGQGEPAGSVRKRLTQAWFSEVHVKSPWRIEAQQLAINRSTGHGLLATVGVPSPTLPPRGFSSARASVRVEYPRVSAGKQVLAHGCAPDTFEGDSLSSRELAISPGDIPTAIVDVPLHDDGTGGDALAQDFVWSAELPSLGKVDGVHALRYALDVTYTDDSGRSCTQHRETFDTVTMEPDLDAGHSAVSDSATPTGHNITFTPQDQFGNPLGCGVSMHPSCSPGCTCAQVFDHGDGSYTVTTKGPDSLGCNCFSLLGEEFCAGAKLVAPDVEALVCVESATEVLLDVKVTGGTAIGRVLDANGQPTGEPIRSDDPRVLVPLGVTRIRWSVSDGARSFDVVQTVTVREGSDGEGNCCPEGTVVLTGTDYANFYYLPEEESYCVLGRDGQDAITTGPLEDVVFGGGGGDAITNNSQAGFSAGGAGDDSLVSVLGGTLHGGDGQDFVYSCDDSDVWGNAGDDVITVTRGTNHIYPNAGRDVVTGGAGSDVVTLFDPCELTAGKVLDGGAGVDTLVTPVPVASLLERGLWVVNFEQVVVRTDLAYLAQCK